MQSKAKQSKAFAYDIDIEPPRQDKDQSLEVTRERFIRRSLIQKKYSIEIYQNNYTKVKKD